MLAHPVCNLDSLIPHPVTQLLHGLLPSDLLLLHKAQPFVKNSLTTAQVYKAFSVVQLGAR